MHPEGFALDKKKNKHPPIYIQSNEENDWAMITEIFDFLPGKLDLGFKQWESKVSDN